MAEESRLQARTIRYARSRGALAKRNHMGPGAEVGWPDVEFFFPGGRVLLVEFKASGGRLRKIQAYRIAKLRELGHAAVVCDDFEQAKSLIDSYYQ